MIARVRVSRRLGLGALFAAASLRLGLACTSFGREAAPPPELSEAGLPIDAATADADAGTSSVDAAGPCGMLGAQSCETFEDPVTTSGWERAPIDRTDGTAEVVHDFGRQSSSSFHGVVIGQAERSCLNAETARRIDPPPVNALAFGFDVWLGDRTGAAGFPDDVFHYIARIEVTEASSQRCHLLIAAKPRECGLWVQETVDGTLLQDPAPLRDVAGPPLVGRWSRFRVTTDFSTRRVALFIDDVKCLEHTAEHCLRGPPSALELRVGSYCATPRANTTLETFHDNLWFQTL